MVREQSIQRTKRTVLGLSRGIELRKISNYRGNLLDWLPQAQRLQSPVMAINTLKSQGDQGSLRSLSLTEDQRGL